MKILLASAILFIPNLLFATSNDSSQPNDLKIARVVRQAVHDADETLLNSPVFGHWRDYLKIAAMDLDIQLQPLVLIRFDEDSRFRNQLKKIVEWEADWERVETQYYAYYFRWDHPLPELIMEVQDVHFQQLSKLFDIKLTEKIAYRYDLDVDRGIVYPFEDLRGGIVSSQPFDLELAAQAILNMLGPEMACVTRPLARIYGTYFHNESTAEAYFDKSLREIKARGYMPALSQMREETFEPGETQAWYSAFAFVYRLNEAFGPRKISLFLSSTNSEMTDFEVGQTFKEIFGTPLSEFEAECGFYQAVNKL